MKDGQVNAVRIGILAVALLAAIAVAFLVRGLVSSEPEEQVAETKVIEAPTSEVLVAGKSIELGHRIGGSDIRWQKWPEEAVTASYVTRKDEPDALTSFRGAIARTPLSEGEPVTKAKLVSLGNAGFMSALISPGMRAVSLPISPETSAGGFILPNDRVDVLLTSERRSEASRGVTYSAETLLENIRVLAIDQTFRESDGAQVVVGKTATLEMRPEEAEAFLLGQARGEISLALRSMADASEELVGAPRAKSVAGGSVNLIQYGNASAVQPRVSGGR